jgi:hypothetical protein
LSRDEFRPPRRGVIERVLEWIAERIARLFGLLGGGGPGAVIGWLLVLAVLVGTIALIVAGVRRARGRLVAAPDPEPEIVTTTRRPAAAWRADAAAHAAAGRWREAMRCRYRAVVADLADRGVVDEGPGLTTGGERTQVATALPALAAPFASASDAFDRGIYGGEPVGPDALAPLDALDAAVTGALDEPRQAVP